MALVAVEYERVSAAHRAELQARLAGPQTGLLHWLGWPDDAWVVRHMRLCAGIAVPVGQLAAFARYLTQAQGPELLRELASRFQRDLRLDELLAILALLDAGLPAALLLDVLRQDAAFGVTGWMDLRRDWALLRALDGTAKAMDPEAVVTNLAALRRRFGHFEGATLPGHQRLDVLDGRVAKQQPPYEHATRLVTVAALETEAQRMANCVRDYAGLLLTTPEVQIWHVHAPDEATVRIELGWDGRWRCAELAGHGNRKPAPGVRAMVHKWLRAQDIPAAGMANGET